MSNYQVQHEFDDEPTYIVSPPDSDSEVVTLSERLPWELRLRLATLLARVLESSDPSEFAVRLTALVPPRGD